MEHTQSNGGVDGRPRTGADDGWPWNCTRCGTTMYHDAVTCRECDRTVRNPGGPAGAGPRELPGATVAWMRRQSYPSFVSKVAAIAGLELLLTTFWIRLLFVGPPGIPAFVPF